MKLATKTLNRLVLPLAIVDWMKPFPDAYPGAQEPSVWSKYGITSQFHEHEVNLGNVFMHEGRQRIHDENNAGNHVISVRRIVHEVVLHTIVRQWEPSYKLVVVMPKGV